MSDMPPPAAPRQTDRWLSPARPTRRSSTSSISPGWSSASAGSSDRLAYINRGKAGGFVETHYTWLIRTFWIGLLYALISAVLMIFAIGFVLLFAVAVWFIVRCIIGLQALQGRADQEPRELADLA